MTSCQVRTVYLNDSIAFDFDPFLASSNSHRGCQCGHCDNICDPIPFVDDSDLNISGNMGDYGSFSLDVAELQSFALQVACGMVFALFINFPGFSKLHKVQNIFAGSSRKPANHS